MRFQGKISKWNDERGFGFIEPAKGGQELFVHIKAFAPGLGRPQVGAMVSFEVEPAQDGKKRAVRIEPMTVSRGRGNKPPVRQKSWNRASLSVLGVFVLSYPLILLFGRPLPYAWAAYLGMSVVTFGFYWVDKRAAEANAWRISESTLITLGALCGWPGAVVGQHVFQHKTIKESFRIQHWVSVIFNLLCFYALTTPLLTSIPQRWLR
ncbi:MAG: DUF1294 domain-containing protein [Rhodoferax sp.]|nr:MAG: DUF1294 domain-containing protein [Rhodoferax sp.]